MTFLGTFWKPQNLEIQVHIFEHQVQVFENLKKTSRILCPKSNVPGLQIEYPRAKIRVFWSQIRVVHVRFSKKNAERARFETSEIEGVGIGPNGLESVQRAPKRLGFEVSRASLPIRPRRPPSFCFLHTPVWGDFLLRVGERGRAGLFQIILFKGHFASRDACWCCNSYLDL